MNFPTPRTLLVRIGAPRSQSAIQLIVSHDDTYFAIRCLSIEFLRTISRIPTRAKRFNERSIFTRYKSIADASEPLQARRYLENRASEIADLKVAACIHISYLRSSFLLCRCLTLGHLSLQVKILGSCPWPFIFGRNL